MSGDFKFKFESKQPKCKFYFWLNVAAILYNNELKEVTTKRNELRNKSLLGGPSPKNKKTNQLLEGAPSEINTQEERTQTEADRWVPIHFEDFSEIEESFFMNDKERNAVMYPKKYERELMMTDLQVHAEGSIEEQKDQIKEENSQQANLLDKMGKMKLWSATMYDKSKEQHKVNRVEEKKSAKTLQKIGDDDSEIEDDETVSVDDEDKVTDDGTDLEPEQKIDLWKKLQDLMQNQISEEHKTLRKKEKDQTSMQKKFFKIWLPRDELDKFAPKKAERDGFGDFGVHLVLSQRQQIEDQRNR